MKVKIGLSLVAAVIGLSCATLAQESSPKPDQVRAAFWGRFQAAVARGDKASVAAMTGYPLAMPYGVKSIRNKAQLLKSYNKIFDAQTKQCFAAAAPQPDESKGKKFSINCGEAMMYWFELRNGNYKFVAVDNVNE